MDLQYLVVSSRQALKQSAYDKFGKDLKLYPVIAAFSNSMNPVDPAKAWHASLVFIDEH